MDASHSTAQHTDTIYDVVWSRTRARRVSDAGVRAVTDSSVAACLRELNLANCARVGDIALVAIIKRCAALPAPANSRPPSSSSSTPPARAQHST